MSRTEPPDSDDNGAQTSEPARSDVPRTAPENGGPGERASIVDNLKAVGIVVGSLGSIAALFYWIGNAVIISRLRAYDLYGIVRYTDEYVTEAGYRFFLDHLSFFQEPSALSAMLVLAVIVLLFVTMPLGPFARGTDSAGTEAPASNFLIRWAHKGYLFLRNAPVRYLVFALLAIAAVVAITADLPLSGLHRRIDRQELRLTHIRSMLDNADLVFDLERLPPGKESTDPALEDRFGEFSRDEELETGTDVQGWVRNSLDVLGMPAPGGREGADLRARLKLFQDNVGIAGESPEILEGDFVGSATYRKLLDLRIGRKARDEFGWKTKRTLGFVRKLRNALPEGETDFVAIMQYSAAFRQANDALRDLAELHRTIGGFYTQRLPGGASSRDSLWERIGEVRPVRFGQFLLASAFWVLVGLLVYLILNSPKLLRFAHLELVYFITMLLLFLTLAVNLPAAYGKYRFDFKLLRLVDIAFREGDNRPGEIERKIRALQDNNANLYILGSTKGNEVIMGAISENATPQIVILQREAFTLVKVEPLKPDEALYPDLQRRP